MSLKNFMSYEDAATVLGEYAGEINQLKSGLTNLTEDVKLNTQDLTTPSRTKNLLPLSIDRLKKSNTTGTWAGNVYTIGYNTYTVSVDDNGVVTSIEGTSTNIDSSAIKLDFDLKAGNYILSSGFVELFGANDTFLQKDGVTIARGNDASPGQNFTLSEDSELTWFFRVTNITKVSYPMIRLSTEIDDTFAPYIPSVESRIEAVESGLTNCVTIEKHSLNPNASFSIALETTKLYNIEFTSINNQSVYNYYKYAIRYVSGSWNLCEISKIENNADYVALSFVITDNNLVVTVTGGWGVVVMCQIASILL